MHEVKSTFFHKVNSMSDTDTMTIEEVAEGLNIHKEDILVQLTHSDSFMEIGAYGGSSEASEELDFLDFRFTREFLMTKIPTWRPYKAANKFTNEFIRAFMARKKFLTERGDKDFINTHNEHMKNIFGDSVIFEDMKI